MRLFVAIASFEREGSIVPYALGLKLCGEHKVLDLLADTFALWSQNLQVLFDFKAMAITSLNLFFLQFCQETTKFVEISLQHMPMELIPDLSDVTILLSNLQKNPSVRSGCIVITVCTDALPAARTKSHRDQCFVPAANM
jgi:hypothetical protein